jgi:hypothetical protein
MNGNQHRGSLKATDLNVREVYRTPTGRLCRVLPATSKDGHCGSRPAGEYVFEYLDGARGDGFALTAKAVSAALRKAGA